jgi:hypothetical protein
MAGADPFWPAATASVESGRAEGLAVDVDRPVEFLTDLVTNVPDGTPETEVEATKAAEKLRAGELVKHPPPHLSVRSASR